MRWWAAFTEACALARHGLPWDRLEAWPGDDRIVPEDHPASNTGRISACAGSAPITGTQPRRKEKIWMRMMPIQKTGSETNSGGMPRNARRSGWVAP